MQLDDDKFKKLRAVFGFRSLPADPDIYPPQVLKAAARAQELLYTLQAKNEAEKAQNGMYRLDLLPIWLTVKYFKAGNSNNPPRFSGFYKTDIHNDCFQYLVKSNVIFKPAADPTDDSVTELIDLTADSGMQTPRIYVAESNCWRFQFQMIPILKML